jgi:uncharacterized membrane protein YbhN (UPF0104 family)
VAALTVSPRARRLLQLGFGAAVVVGTIAVVGTGPLARGVLAVSPGAILAAALLTAVATSAAAWRWQTVSAELGLPMRWTTALTAYYRSQFLNTVLPGGVIGDVHRAYRQGRRAGDVPIAARAVATERVAGQVVQFALTAVILAALGLTGPLTGWLIAVAWVAAGAAAVVVVAVVFAMGTVRGRRMLRHELSLLRKVFGSPRASIAIVASSIVVVASHSATFVIACLAVGVEASPRELLALAVIALAAASLPINVGGWGPREAASASAFAVIGLGAGAGLAASTAFGILTIIAVLPGAVVLVVDRVAAARTAPARDHPSIPVRSVHPRPEEIAA